jgi:hypothetical protein
MYPDVQHDIVKPKIIHLEGPGPAEGVTGVGGEGMT